MSARGEMPDPVDDHYLTAAAALTPDDSALPGGWCDCESCIDVRFALIVARNPDLALIPPTEET